MFLNGKYIREIDYKGKEMAIIKLPLPSTAPNCLPFPLPFPLLKKLEIFVDFCSREENQSSKGVGGKESNALEEYTPL